MGLLRSRRLPAFVGLVTLLAAIACFMPNPRGLASYTAVSAQPADPLCKTPKVHRTTSWYGGPDYYIEDGEMYLRNQTVHHSFILTTYVSRGILNSEDIQYFRRNHPELEGFWPDRGQHDGGVAWTQEKLRELRSRHESNSPGSDGD